MRRKLTDDELRRELHRARVEAWRLRQKLRLIEQPPKPLIVALDGPVPKLPRGRVRWRFVRGRDPKLPLE